MAWVSVYEEVNGPKLRKLAKRAGCSKATALGSVVTIWLWGLKNADETGIIDKAEKEDIAEVLELMLPKEIKSLDFVEAMIEVGWIDEVEEGLCIHDWDVWQEPWNAYNRKRKKDAEYQREKRRKERDSKNGGKHEDVPDEEPAGDKSEGEKPAPKGSGKYTVAFEEFWVVYPKKADKGAALVKFNARLKDGYSKEEMIEAAKRYASQCSQNGTETRFIKNASTFLGPTLAFTEFLDSKLGSSQPTTDSDSPYPEEWGDMMRGED